MSSSTMIRAQTKARVVELLIADTRLGTQRVNYGEPPQGVPIEGVWLHKMHGRMPIANMRATRLHRDDEWTIDVVCFAGLEGQTAYDAELRAQALFAPLEDALADDPKLGGVVDGLLWATLDGECELYAEPDGDGEGYVAWVFAVISCRARLT